MTGEHTDIITTNKTKPDKDPNSLKIASFRTKEGVWAEFCQKAESIGQTATDVIKAAMEQFISGEYDPKVGKSLIHHDKHHDSILTRDEIIDIVNTAVNTAVSTLSLPSHDDVSTMVSTKLTALNSEIAILKEDNKKTLLELEYQRGDIEKLRTAVSTQSSPSTGLTRDEVIDIVNTAVSTLSLPSHDDVSTAINTAFSQLVEELARLETAFSDQLKEKVKPAKRTRTGDEVSWARFHKKVEISPIPRNPDRNADDADIAIATARDKGLGEWACDTKEWYFYPVPEQIGQIETEPDTI